MTLSLNQQLLLAPQVAARAHKNQKRKDGTPYIAHPVRVALRVQYFLGGHENWITRGRIVAFLHDVVEDTDITFDDLRDMGFSEAILQSLDAVTKRPGEKYADFILRIKNTNDEGGIAIAVKLADIEDNLEDQSALDPDEAAFLTKRYTKAQEVLRG